MELSKELQEWVYLESENYQGCAHRVMAIEVSYVQAKLAELEAKISKQAEFIKKVHLYAWSVGLSPEELEALWERDQEVMLEQEQRHKKEVSKLKAKNNQLQQKLKSKEQSAT